MMHPDMLLLAERLVLAMETISQDVKNMSAYVYDISCCVSYLLNEKRKKECVSVASCNEGEDCSSVTSEQYEQADERLSSYIGDPDHEEISLGYIALANNDPHENTDVMPAESTPTFSGGMKIEEQVEVEVNDESNDITILKERKSETQWVTEGDDQAYDLHTTISHSTGQLTPSDLLKSIKHASAQVQQDIQHVESSSNSAVNSTSAALVSRAPGAETSLARTQQTERAIDSSDMHMGGHVDERACKCSFCGKLFSLRCNLQMHGRVHTGERPYKCNECEKAFAQSGNLSLHIRSHTVKRPYGCSVCRKVFADKGVLRRHMRTHTGEKPYSCDVCGKAFRQKNHLTTHVRIHTGEKPFRCALCGIAFRHSNRLSRHMHTHSQPN